MNFRLLRVYSVGFAIAIAIAIAGFPTGEILANDVVGFDQVKPILRKRCVTCHGPDELRGDLNLKELTALRAGSGSGDVVVAGDPSASLLYTTIAHLDDPVMPPNSPPIPAREQDIIRRWIEGGLAEKTGPTSTSAESIDAAASASAESMNATDSRAGYAAAAGPFSAIQALPQPAALRALAVHPTRDLAAVNGLQQAVLFVASSGEVLGAIDIAEGEVSALRFSTNGKLLMVAAGEPAISGTVLAYDLDTGKKVWQVADETDSILTFDLSPAGDVLAVGGPTKTVRMYDVASGQELHALKKHTDWILSVRFSPDGLLLASSDRFGGIHVWEPKSGTLFHDLKDHDGAVHGLAWDENSETLLSAGEDGKIRTWNLHHGDLTSAWDGQVGPVLALVRSSNYTAAAGRAGQVAVWTGPDALLGKVDLKQQVEVLACGAGGQPLIAGDIMGTVTILDVKTLGQTGSLRLPENPNSMEQLLVRLDRLEEDYETANAVRLQLAAADKQSVGMASGNAWASADVGASPSPEKVAMDSARLADNPANPEPFRGVSGVGKQLAGEIEASYQQIGELEEAIEQSNRMLSDMAEHNRMLIELVRQSSVTQSQIAEQIQRQTKLLQSLRLRTEQMELAR